MSKISTVLCLLILPLLCHSQGSEFQMPWKDTSKAILIDPYESNSIDWQKLSTNKQLTGMIHKASQGLRKDTKYASRKSLALQQGLLWGSYHLGTPGDPIRQANFYLEQIGRDSTILMALDIETLDAAKSMSLKNAEKFIAHIKAETGRYPMLYCNNEVFVRISQLYDSSSIFAKCGLWYARFRKNIPSFSTRVWPSYSLWQFSCEINCKPNSPCLYTVAGTKPDMDINVYNGTIAEIRAKWPSINK